MSERIEISKKLLFSEKTGIILDIGILYTKIGFIGDNLPRKIHKTPFNLFKQIKTLNLDKNVFLADCFKDQKSLAFELEQFLHDIFFTELLINPQERSVFYVENLMTPRIFTETLAEILYKSFNVKKVYFMMANSMPLYCTGLYSGVVIDCGFYETQILPIYEGFPLTKALKFTKAGGYQQDLLLKKKLFFEDNPNLNDKVFDINRIENMKFKFITVPAKKQYEDYTSSEENIKKMKHSIQEMKHQIHDEQTGQWASIKISYFTRLQVGNYMFGNVDEDQPNIAYSILESLLEVNDSCLLKVAKNMILTGGQCLMPGFTRRLKEELMYFLKQQQFKSLRHLEDNLQFTNLLSPPNTLHLIGTSMIGSINGVDQFMVSCSQYERSQVRDKFGDQYLHIYQEENVSQISSQEDDQRD